MRTSRLLIKKRKESRLLNFFNYSKQLHLKLIGNVSHYSVSKNNIKVSIKENISNENDVKQIIVACFQLIFILIEEKAFS